MYTMVIADDEELTLQALVRFVGKEFPDVTVVATAANGMELIAAVEKHKPDVAIVDVSMPRINGIDAIELLRSRGVNTRYILNTAYGEFAYAKRALELKVDAYLLKPEKREKTVETIERVCREIDAYRAQEKEREELHALMREMDHALEGEITLSLLTDGSASAFENYCALHKLSFACGAVVTLENTEGEAGETLSRSELRRCLEQVIAPCCGYLANISPKSITVLLLLPEAMREENAAWISGLLSALLRTLGESGAEYRAGVSCVYPSFAQMGEACRESIMALRGAHKQRVIFFADTAAEAEDVQQQTANPYILQAMRFIRGNYRQDVSLDMVAEHIGISPSYLSHLFSQETGMTLGQMKSEARA